jgi:hypothetical protein
VQGQGVFAGGHGGRVDAEPRCGRCGPISTG